MGIGRSVCRSLGGGRCLRHLDEPDAAEAPARFRAGWHELEDDRSVLRFLRANWSSVARFHGPPNCIDFWEPCFLQVVTLDDDDVV
ncbi:hypothetical protein CGMCC3_g653 [Colletotrichum fructicola]|nr:uncharacterized protein CGMCC3_g653 [Colletotrichum fructicola]KAE9583909.1 hypothetical protein CGMCC3_g653 [Colletotrichum fructicola]